MRGGLRPVETLAGTGFGERRAALEAQVVHRCLLAHGEILAPRLTFALFGRAGDVDGDLRLDFGMRMDGHHVQAERLDRMLDRDVAALNGVPGGGQRLGGVAPRDGTAEPSARSRLTDDAAR